MRDPSLSATISESPLADIIGEGDALFRHHWEEVALNKGVMVLKPDIDRYRQLEAAGMVIALAARIGDELVGYSVSFITTHLHYADLVVANNDVLFVSRAHRAGRVGLQLIRKTEQAAKARGARLMLWHAKPATVLEALMPRLGYGVQDVIFSKEL